MCSSWSKGPPDRHTGVNRDRRTSLPGPGRSSKTVISRSIRAALPTRAPVPSTAPEHPVFPGLSYYSPLLLAVAGGGVLLDRHQQLDVRLRLAHLRDEQLKGLLLVHVVQQPA